MGSDLKGAKKVKWTRFDEKFEREERGGSGSEETWFNSLPWNNGNQQKAQKAKQEFFGEVGRGGAAERAAAKKAAAKRGKLTGKAPGSIYVDRAPQSRSVTSPRSQAWRQEIAKK